MRINIVTIFPDCFGVPFATSIPGRAAEAGLAEYRLVDLRDYTHDRHRTVDDEPYGGGAGMVMKPEPFFEAVEALDPAGPVVLLTPRGTRFDHGRRCATRSQEELTLLCGHYKGVDERVAGGLVTEELSVGDFVLSGGEPAALAVMDAVVRLLPGALGDHESAATDSFYEGLPGAARVHAAGRVSGHARARGAAVGRSRPGRGVAPGAGPGVDAGAQAGAAGTGRGRGRGRERAGDGG